MRTSESLHTLTAYGASDLGRVRAINEDTFICDPDRGVFAVIDGVGGHAGGEVAAAIARRELDLRLRRETGTVEDRIREAIAAANASILAEAERDPALRHMACVLTVAVVARGRVIAGHVGDTRLYKLGPSGLQKLTHDHSPVGQLEDRGHLREEDAMRHPDRNQVFREVGTQPHQPTDADFIEVVSAPFEDDDGILLCSDGVSDQLTSAEMEHIIRGAADPTAAVNALLQAANAAGGRDNATAILATGPLFGTPAIRRRRTGDTAELRPAAAPPAALETSGEATRRHGHSTAARVLLSATVLALAAVAVLWPTGTFSPTATNNGAPKVLVVSSTPGAEFTSIGAALDAAQPGDVVAVEPGIYRETVTLKDGVALRARQRRTVVLQPPAGLAGPWTAISASAVRSGSVSGLVVNGEGAPLEYGAVVQDADVELDDLDIAGARAAAVHVAGRSAVRIRSSVIRDSAGAGILVDADSAPEILHNVLSGNGRATPPRAAIELSPGARATIVGNILKGNGQAVAGAPPAELARIGMLNAIETPPHAAR